MRTHGVGETLRDSRAVLRQAAGVDVDGEVAQAPALKELLLQSDDLDVGGGIRLAEGLDAELVKLALAAGLGPLAAEHGADVIQPRPIGGRALAGGVADHAGGALGPQRQAASAAVGKGVHLLLDHVGGFAERAGEHRGVLQRRRADFAEAVERQNPARLLLQVLPEKDLGRGQIRHARDGLKQRGIHRRGPGRLRNP